MIIKTEGIVLKSFDFRETSRIATFFTKEEGKVKGILKGIRKDPKKFGSHIDQYSVNDIVYYQYRHSDLHLISHCDLKVFFFAIRQNLKKTMAASYILELVNAIMPAEEKNSDVYQLMLDFLNALEHAQDISKLVHLFQIKILILSGFRPHLDCCLVCRKKIIGTSRFSLSKGGLICLACQKQDLSASLISAGSVASIIHVEKNPWTQCLKLGLSDSIKKELKYILNNFLVFHLEKRLKSERFLS